MSLSHMWKRQVCRENIDGMIICSSKYFPNSGSCSSTTVSKSNSCSSTTVSKSNRHLLSRGRSSRYSPLNGVFARPLSSTTITLNAFSSDMWSGSTPAMKFILCVYPTWVSYTAYSFNSTHCGETSARTEKLISQSVEPQESVMR